MGRNSIRNRARFYMRLLGSHLDTFNDVAELWALLNPTPGMATVTVTFSSAPDFVVGGSASYFNVASVDAAHLASNDATGGTAASVVVSSSSGDLVVDTLAATNLVASVTISVTGSGQTQRWNKAGSAFTGGGSDQPASSPVTMSWSLSTTSPSTNHWSQIAVPLTPAATTTTTTTVIPEYPFGAAILALFMLVAYGLVRRRGGVRKLN